MTDTTTEIYTLQWQVCKAMATQTHENKYTFILLYLSIKSSTIFGLVAKRTNAYILCVWRTVVHYPSTDDSHCKTIGSINHFLTQNVWPRPKRNDSSLTAPERFGPSPSWSSFGQWKKKRWLPCRRLRSLTTISNASSKCRWQFKWPSINYNEQK